VRQRGKTAEWHETWFKSNADVASRITFLPRLDFSVFFLLREHFQPPHVSGKSGKAKERKRETPLSPNFKHL